MPAVNVVTRDGRQLVLAAKPGRSLMEILRDGGVDDIEAVCGGACACATCHVYVDPAFAAHLPPMKSDESDLLDCSDHRTERSRLSCQLRFADALDGVELTVAPAD